MQYPRPSPHSSCACPRRPRRQARGLSSALSAANAVCNHVRDWLLGTPSGSWTSMGVVSDGSYGVAPGLVRAAR